MERIVARTVEATLVAPFIPHAQGKKSSLLRLTSVKPSGNGIPRKNAAGAIKIRAMINLGISGRNISPRNIGSRTNMYNTTIPQIIDIAKAINFVVLTKRSKNLLEK